MQVAAYRAMLLEARDSNGTGAVPIRVFSPRNLCASATPRLVSVEILLTAEVLRRDNAEN